MPDSTGSTLGQRLYRIRLDRGDGLRKPEPMKAFAAYLRDTFPDVKGLSESALSGWENDLTDPNRHQIWALATADPKQRGPAWLAWGDAVPVVGETGHNGDTLEVTDAAALAEAEREAARKAELLRRYPPQGQSVPHAMYRPATTPTPAEIARQERETARARRPGTGGKGRGKA